MFKKQRHMGGLLLLFVAGFFVPDAAVSAVDEEKVKHLLDLHCMLKAAACCLLWKIFVPD